MGLSDQERTSYVFNSIQKIADLSEELFDKEYQPLKNLVDKLWTSVLGGTSNGAHWILGSSATNPIKLDDFSVYSVALRDGFDDDKRNINADIEREKDPNYKSIEERMDENFDPLRNSLNIESLIDDSDEYQSKEHAIVFQIFSWTEQLVYALRRYDDEYLEKLGELSNLVGSIQGACFNFFKRPIYRKAYLMRQICEILYKRYDNGVESKLVKIFDDKCLHHKLTRACNMEVSIRQLLDWHERLVFNDADEERIYVAFEICGRKMHDEYELSDYIKAFNESKIKVDIKKLKEIFKKNVKDHKDREEDEMKRYSNNKESDHFYCVHGKFLSDVKKGR